MNQVLGRSRSVHWALVRSLLPVMFLSAFLNNTPCVTFMVGRSPSVRCGGRVGLGATAGQRVLVRHAVSEWGDALPEPIAYLGGLLTIVQTHDKMGHVTMRALAKRRQHRCAGLSYLERHTWPITRPASSCARQIPILLSWSRRCGVPPKKLLIPLSYAAVLGGTCTSIGTSTNLVIVGMQVRQLGCTSKQSWGRDLGPGGWCCDTRKHEATASSRAKYWGGLPTVLWAAWVLGSCLRT